MQKSFFHNFLQPRPRFGKLSSSSLNNSILRFIHTEQEMRYIRERKFVTSEKPKNWSSYSSLCARDRMAKFHLRAKHQLRVWKVRTSILDVYTGPLEMSVFKFPNSFIHVVFLQSDWSVKIWNGNLCLMSLMSIIGDFRFFRYRFSTLFPLQIKTFGSQSSL